MAKVNQCINEFMSQVDTYSTVYGVVWVSCIKPAGAPYARWRMAFTIRRDQLAVMVIQQMEI